MTIRQWTPQEHPTLFFGRAEVETLRAKRTADEIAAAAWRRVEEEIEKGMAGELPRQSDRWEFDTGADGQKCLGQITGEINLAATNLGLSWLLDGVEAHARKAVDILMALCEFDFWTSLRFFGTDYRLPWRGTLETAELCHAAACGYDWLYDFMSESERHRLRTCLLYKGAQPLVQDWADPHTRLPLSTHIKPWGNWWQNCIAPAGEAAIALYGEHPLAERFVRLCKEASDWFFAFEGGVVPDLPSELLPDNAKPGTYYPPNFDCEGGYCEGMGYLDVLIRTCYFSEAYRRRMREELLPIDLIHQVAGLILNGNFRIGDRMRAVDFGDTPGGFANGPVETTYFARLLRHSGMQWFFHNCQHNFSEPLYYRSGDSPAFTFLWYDPALGAEEPKSAPPVKVYPGMGMAVMRSGWGHEDSMLALKCGPTAGHAHPDANSFVLYSRDELLLLDSGCCGYEMPEQQEYFQTTRAHNTVLVGGEGQIKRLAGRIVEQASVPNLGFVLGDATDPYEGRVNQFLRGILFVAGEYYVVADWLRKPGGGRFQWLLHYDGTMTPSADGYLIEKGGAGVLVKMIEPSEHYLEIRQGYKTYLQDPFLVRTTAERQRDLEPGHYLEITPDRDSSRQDYLTVLYPFQAGSERPEIEAVRGRGWAGIRVQREDEVDLVGLRLPGGRTGLGLHDVETDAAFFCLTCGAKGRPVRAFMRAGTYLKIGDQLLASSPKRATVVVASNP